MAFKVHILCQNKSGFKHANGCALNPLHEMLRLLGGVNIIQILLDVNETPTDIPQLQHRVQLQFGDDESYEHERNPEQKPQSDGLQVPQYMQDGSRETAPDDEPNKTEYPNVDRTCYKFTYVCMNDCETRTAPIYTSPTVQSATFTNPRSRSRASSPRCRRSGRQMRARSPGATRSCSTRRICARTAAPTPIPTDTGPGPQSRARRWSGRWSEHIHAGVYERKPDHQTKTRPRSDHGHGRQPRPTMMRIIETYTLPGGGSTHSRAR
ncbi:hypothetical protein AUP68_06490 [Ilyonectria robusta]